MKIKGDAKDIRINICDTAIKASTETVAQEVVTTVGKTANKVIESGGDIVNAPGVWLKDIQQNWHLTTTTAIVNIQFTIGCIQLNYGIKSLKCKSKFNEHCFTLF